MKQQIATYFREYRENFRQKPFQTAAVLIMQILFLFGWGLFFYYLSLQYIRYIIPGISEPKGNIYVETINGILQLIVFSYVVVKIWPLMFDNNRKLRWRFIALLISFLTNPFIIISHLFSKSSSDISAGFETQLLVI